MKVIGSVPTGLLLLMAVLAAAAHAAAPIRADWQRGNRHAARTGRTYATVRIAADISDPGQLSLSLSHPLFSLCEVCLSQIADSVISILRWKTVRPCDSASWCWGRAIFRAFPVVFMLLLAGNPGPEA